MPVRCLPSEKASTNRSVHAHRVRNEGRKISSNINVTPMVDVMLVLLIIFMVITPLLRGPRIELAETQNASRMLDADKDDALLVAINRDGQVFLGNEIIPPRELTERIRDRIATRSDKTAFVRADARVHFRAVAEVVNEVRSAGVNELGLLTERKLQ